MLEIILSHESALMVWNDPRAAAGFWRLSKECVRNAMHETPDALSYKDVGAIRSGFKLEGLPEPLHLLVSEARKRRKLKAACFHVEGSDLPQGSLVQVSANQKLWNKSLINLMCVSPELMYCQLAYKMDFLGLVELGYELCGGYAQHGASRELRERAPVISLVQLRSGLDSLAGVHGSKQAARAAKYLLENSWSPKESQIAIMLTLPRRMGGFGIEPPLLNYEIAVPDETKRVLKGDKIIPDMYWPDAKVVLEYDSNEHHFERDSIEHDARKRSAYELMGIDLVSVTYDQLRDFLTFAHLAEHLADLLAGHADKRRLPTSQQQRSKQLQVHNRLLYGRRDSNEKSGP